MTRKPFGVPDPQLWDEVKATISPFKRGRRPKLTPVGVEKSALAGLPHGIQTPTAVAPKSRPARSDPPALAGFDRRTAQKLGRGQSEPEARIDLHGENLETARFALLQFLASRRMQGHKLVLVITGKGASPFARHTLHGISHFHTPERQGKLRREVPLWLEEAQFRIHVIGYQPAHPRHGGGGAFYVRLRKHGTDLS